MPKSDDRQYFIVRHDLYSFTLLPGLIWRGGVPESKTPRGFRMVKPGDLWIEFAYTRDEEIDESKRCSLVVGFNVCTKEAAYGRFPYDRATSRPHSAWPRKGWMIDGRPYGKQPLYPVVVPSINQLLRQWRSRVVGRDTLTRIWRDEFDHIRTETFLREFDPGRIPLLAREPSSEQEVLSIVVAARWELGIDKIVWVQDGFPDMLVNVGGKELYLEVEKKSLDFLSHRHHIKSLRHVRGVRGRWEAKLKDKGDSTPVGIVCWADNDDDRELRKRVRRLRVYELQSLFRKGEKIRLP